MPPNPQLENGYLRIATELAEALARVNLWPNESKILWCLIRMTYGYNRKADRISASQFARGTGLPQRSVWRTLKTLIARRIVAVERKTPHQLVYLLQKDYSKWLETLSAPTVSAPTVSAPTPNPDGGDTINPVGPDRHHKQKTVSKDILRAGRTPANGVGGFKETMAVYHDLFLQKFGAKPDIDGRDGKLLSGLLKSHGAGEVTSLLRYFFEHPPDWVAKKGKFTIPSFKSAYTELLVQSRSGGNKMGVL